MVCYCILLILAYFIGLNHSNKNTFLSWEALDHIVVAVALLQGYQGMVDGGEDNIKEATWESVSSMLQVVSKAHRKHTTQTI